MKPITISRSFLRFSGLFLLGFLVLAPFASAAELTAMERLCASYEKKKIMLQQRVKRGVHAWEKDKIKEQFATLEADSAKHCSKPAVVDKPK